MIATQYSRQPINDEAAYQHKLKTTQGYFHKEMQVLEFGCGTGSTALTHAPFVRSIHAIDYSGKMIKIAKEKAHDARAMNVTFQKSTIEELDVPDESYDAVLGLSILHLLLNKEVVIDQVFRLLKPGGIFVSSTVCVGDMKAGIANMLLPIGSALRLLPVVKVFGADELAKCITKAGFDIDYQWQPRPGKSVFIVAKKP